MGWEDLRHSFVLPWPGSVTYSFIQSPPADADYGDAFFRADTRFGLPTEEQQSIVTRLLERAQEPDDFKVSFSDVANVSFLMDSSGDGDLKIGRANLATTGEGAAAFPGYRLGFVNDGDIWISNNAAYENFSNPEFSNLATKAGQNGYWTLLHELTHAFGGLMDAVDAFQGSAENNQQYTVMSYNTIGTVTVNGQLQTSLNSLYFEDTAALLKPYGLQLYDIKAVQDVYGANTNTRSGDTIYALGAGLGRDDDPDKSFIYTIWDGGGEDAIDASGFADYQARIDLNAGAFSSIGTTGFVEQQGLRSAYDSARGIDANNVAIAYDVEIENAVGGGKADSITGNFNDNDITGGRGADLLFGGAGNDTYIWNLGDGEDFIQDTSGSDTLLLGRGITEEMVKVFGAGSLSISTVSGYGANFVSYPSFGIENIEGTSFQHVTYSDKAPSITTTFIVATQVTQTVPLDTTNWSDNQLNNFGSSSGPTLGQNVDVIIGTNANDWIKGYGADDVLSGGDGDDRLDGGAGADTLNGNAGRDTLQGDASDILLSGGEDDDYLINGKIMHGDAGNDYITAGNSTATLAYSIDVEGGTGNDRVVVFVNGSHIDGGSDKDSIRVFGNNNSVLGGSDNADDALYANGFGNVLSGGFGNDVLSVDTYFPDANVGSTVDGGDGDDVIHLGRNRNIVVFGAGHDIVYHEQAVGSVVVLDFGTLALSALQASYLKSGTDLTVSAPDGSSIVLVDYKSTPESWHVLSGGIEQSFTPDLRNYISTSAADTISGTGSNDILSGFDGVDTLTGGSGSDILNGGNGNDMLDGGDASDELHGGAGSDTLAGGTGDDVMLGDDGTDLLSGGSGDDAMVGGAGSDTLSGGTGNDIIHGDFVPGISGDAVAIAHILATQSGNDLIEGGAGADTLTGGAGADTFVYGVDAFGAGVDTVTDFGLAEGDRLDLSALLEGFNPGQDAINLFVAVTTSGGETSVAVDRNGAGHFTAVATLAGVAITETVDELVASGKLVVS